MKKSHSLLLIGAAVLTAGLGQAQAKDKKPAMTPEEKFAKLDTDADGKVSLEEYVAMGKDEKKKANLGKMFKKLDKDKDESLSLEEMSKTKKKAPKKKVEEDAGEEG